MTTTGADDSAGRRDPAARRTRLRQYQEQLLERMQAAKNGAGASVAQLGLGIGGARYLVDLADVGEIVAPVPVSPVPLTRPWYLGLANVRGSLLGVIDLARYLDEDNAPATPAAPGSSPRLLVFAPGLGLNCALLASSVYGLRHAGTMTRDGDALRDVDGNTWMPLSLAALVREERFLHIAR
ncbi:chemotaxis protein CheW [Massilia aurea]|uniref:chemotaxis protein CheW n=1 Tax=Massilia aurea TaxID=373040 RepID=UPI0034623BEE